MLSDDCSLWEFFSNDSSKKSIQILNCWSFERRHICCFDNAPHSTSFRSFYSLFKCSSKYLLEMPAKEHAQRELYQFEEALIKAHFFLRKKKKKRKNEKRERAHLTSWKKLFLWKRNRWGGGGLRGGVGVVCLSF